MTDGRKIIVITGAVAAVFIAVAAGVYAHRQVTAPPSAPQAQPAPVIAPVPSPSPSNSTPYAEAPEALPSPPRAWGASGAQQQGILTRVASTAANWADALFSRSWSENETAYVSRASKYQSAAMTQQETRYEATAPARQDWKQLSSQQCAVTVSVSLSAPPDNYTADYPGPHVPSLASQWVVLDFTTDPVCRRPSPALPPVPSVSYERLVQLVPATAGNPDGAWAVTGAFSNWDDSSQSGTVFGDAGGPSPRADGT